MRQGEKFTTIDSDNDDNSGVNCALHSMGANGGWWYRHCSYNSLTGMYFFVCSLLDIKYFIYASVQLTFIIIHEIIYEKINKTSRQLTVFYLGKYEKPGSFGFFSGLTWYPVTGANESLKKVQMKVKRKN